MRIQRSEEHKVMPWKNGLGVTREVALAPSPRPDAPFLWRLSLATIRGSGPFSLFSGIDRTIAALSGKPVRLMVDGKEDATLDALGEPYSFSGDAVVEAITEGGETTDLNIMTLRGSATHRMSRLVCSQSLAVTTEHEFNMIVFTSRATITANGNAEQVDAFDVLLDIGRHESLTIKAATPTTAYLIGIDIAG
ncbi:HutD family protein [Ciceribacter sp. L1K23]|uniref:HutD/Ves family protein n=1 Tax=Ciceribacter sp. L1K23 TaxID=2820276 RepID=UPI001B810866|nr:HutD family protein [Ciceribacter sp. L1K23]MBR0557857.1 HutD family protein [Ciceribacter sp. L1K23]